MALKTTDVNDLLGIGSPWEVLEIEQDQSNRTAKIHVALPPAQQLCCPKCGKTCPGYDHRKRTWRHTKICDYSTVVVANVPRVNCPEHGVITISVPWPMPRFNSQRSWRPM